MLRDVVGAAVVAFLLHLLIQCSLNHKSAMDQPQAPMRSSNLSESQPQLVSATTATRAVRLTHIEGNNQLRVSYLPPRSFFGTPGSRDVVIFGRSIMKQHRVRASATSVPCWLLARCESFEEQQLRSEVKIPQNNSNNHLCLAFSGF